MAPPTEVLCRSHYPMTYILGWRFGQSAYIVADTALTLARPTREERDRVIADQTTSFGELVVRETERVVAEGVLKLIHLDQLAVAFCGDVRTARSVAEAIAFRLRQGVLPREAVQNALLSNAPFSDSSRQIHLIIGIPASREPILLAFNIEGDQRLHEVQDETLVQFGSILPSHKSLTATLLKQLAVFRDEPGRLLACALGIIQSFGVHDYLLSQGAGGSFVGLRVGPNGIRWQQDLLYVLKADLDPMIDIVSSIVRDHVLVVRSNLIHECRYFGDSINDGLNDEWRHQWWDAAFDFTAQGRFDFVLLLNTAARIVSAVEMLKQQETEHFRLRVTPGEGPEEAFRINMAMSPVLTRAAVERLADRKDGSIPFKFNWFPFSPPR